MLFHLPRASGLGILGVIIVTMLFVISCGSAANLVAAKGASTDYGVNGLFWCDDDDSGGWSSGDHAVVGEEVWYSLSSDGVNWGSPAHVHTNQSGIYTFNKTDSQYAMVWLNAPWLTHYAYWYPQPMQIRWDYENTPWTVPNNVGADYPLSFVGSDYLH